MSHPQLHVFLKESKEDLEKTDGLVAAIVIASLVE
jgi:hypothetical protein